MIRTHEIRLYPTHAQERVFVRWFALACQIHNQALAQRIELWRTSQTRVTLYDQFVALTALRRKHCEYADVPVEIFRDALRRLDRSYKAFFRRVKLGQSPGFPRFKQTQRWRSFEILVPGDYVKNNTIRVPKVGRVRGRNFQDILGQQLALRVICRAGRWYALLVTDDQLPVPHKRPIGAAVGVDVGLLHFATLSDGEQVENPRYYRKAEQRLMQLQRGVNRKVKGSRNRRKAIHRLARGHERVRCLRHNHAHQLSRKLVNKYDLIVVEDLNVKGLARTRLAKSVMDAAWTNFIWQLSYKAESAGKTLVKVPPQFTSQDCSGCGFRVKKSLSVREHVCTSCGLILDRDHNAALNILAAGRAVAACGEHADLGRLVEAGSSFQGATQDSRGSFVSPFTRLPS